MQPKQPPLSGEGVGGAWSWEDLVQLSQPHSQVLSPEEGGEGWPGLLPCDSAESKKHMSVWAFVSFRWPD